MLPPTPSYHFQVLQPAWWNLLSSHLGTICELLSGLKCLFQTLPASLLCFLFLQLFDLCLINQITHPYRDILSPFSPYFISTDTIYIFFPPFILSHCSLPYQTLTEALAIMGLYQPKTRPCQNVPRNPKPSNNTSETASLQLWGRLSGNSMFYRCSMFQWPKLWRHISLTIDDKSTFIPIRTLPQAWPNSCFSTCLTNLSKNWGHCT